MNNPILKSNLKIINELRAFISLVRSNTSLLRKFSESDTCFTRNRKLPFDKLVLLIAKLCKKTLSVELEEFFTMLNSESSCSISAFTQQRAKLEPLFFHFWNQVLVKSYYHYYQSEVKRWRNYRVVAVDGSCINLMNNKSLSEYFGGQSNQNCFFTTAKAFYCYDVLNELVIFSQLQPYRIGELTMAYKYIDKTEDDMLLIYDRYFCNYKMIALHQWQEKERKFIIRGNESHKFIEDFINSKKTSTIFYMKPSYVTIKNLKKSGYIINKTSSLKVRLVRVELGNKVEVLVTNLWQEEGYKTKDFKALYFKRWAIETNICFQKNSLQLEVFSGHTPKAVLQDFFATVLMTNLQAVLTKNTQKVVEKFKHRKYSMKINKNKAFAKIKKYWILLLIRRKVKNLLEGLHQHFIKDLVPIRNGRSFLRTVKNKRNYSKYRAYSNFKPAF
jgi:hypothetical protein